MMVMVVAARRRRRRSDLLEMPGIGPAIGARGRREEGTEQQKLQNQHWSDLIT
jgi:hypothetical protein